MIAARLHSWLYYREGLPKSNKETSMDEIRQLQKDLKHAEYQIATADDHSDMRHYRLWTRRRDKIARKLEALLDEKSTSRK